MNSISSAKPTDETITEAFQALTSLVQFHGGRTDAKALETIREALQASRESN